MISFLWRKWIRKHTSKTRTILNLEGFESRIQPAGLAAVGSQPGTVALVTVYDADTKQQKYTISPFPGFTGGVRVALGDVNGDGTADVVVGAGAGGGPIVNIYDGTNGSLLKSFLAGDANSRAGVGVSAGDIDQDGVADIVTGAIKNGQPLLRVTKFSDLSTIKSFTPFSGAAGLSVAVGDVNGDGTPDLVAGSGPKVASAVVVFSGADNTILRSFSPFESTFLGGVSVAAGDVNGDGKADVIVAAGVLGGPRVSVYSGMNGAVTANFFSYTSSLRDGTFAVAYNANSTGNLDLATINGPNNTPDPKAFDSTTTAVISATLLPGLPITTSYDLIAPTVAITTTATNPTAGNPVPFTATFSEAVSGFAAAGISVTNGTIGTVTRVNGKTFNFTVVPAQDGSVSATVNAGAAWDAAGNKNTASTASSVTFDGTPPTVTANNNTSKSATPTLTGTVGESTATVSVVVGGQTIAATVSGTTWTATVPTALAEGTFPITATATDTLGNHADATATLIVDLTAPTPAVTSTAGATTSTSPIPFRIDFGEDVTGFTQSDITVNGGTIASFTAVSAQIYDITVSPTTEGNITVSVAANVTNDIAGNNNNASNAAVVNYDTGAIGLTINPLKTNNPTPTLTGTVTDPTATVEVTVNGQTVTATVNGSTWSATFATIPDGTYDVEVNASDASANTGSATSTGGLVVDTVLPAATLTTTSTSPTNAPIAFAVEFSEAVTGFDASKVSVTNGTVGGFTGSGTSYSFTVTPTAQGDVIVSVPAAAAQDEADNNNTASSTITLEFDSVAPALTAANNTSTTSTPTLTGTVDDSTADVSVEVDGQTIAATISGTTWSATTAALADGTYTATVTATDAAGNTSTATATLVVDTTPPTATISSTAGATTSSSPIPFRIEFDENVPAFAQAAVTVSGGTIADFTAVSATIYDITVTPTAPGDVIVSVAVGAAADAAGNTNTAEASFTVAFSTGDIDLTADPLSTTNPTPTLTGTVGDSSATVEVTVNGQTVSAVVAGNTWSADLTTTVPDGTYDIVVNATSGTNTGSTTLVGGLAVDATAPAATLSTTAISPSNDASYAFTVTFSEVVTGFDDTKVSISNGTISGFSGSGANYSFTVTPVDEGDVIVSIPAAAGEDSLGNTSTASNEVTIVSDITAPVVTVDSLTATTSTPTLTGTVDDPDAGVLVTVNGQSFAATVNGSTWTARVPAALADGTYSVAVTATDLAGNSGSTPGTDALVVDATAPTVASITASPSSGTFGVAATIDITVTFSEAAALAGGSLQLLLDTGASVTLAQDGSDPAKYVGTYTVAGGDTSADLDSTSLTLQPGATLKDAAGNDANLTISAAATLAANADIVIDTTV